MDMASLKTQTKYGYGTSLKPQTKYGYGIFKNTNKI